MNRIEQLQQPLLPNKQYIEDHDEGYESEKVIDLPDKALDQIIDQDRSY